MLLNVLSRTTAFTLITLLTAPAAAEETQTSFIPKWTAWGEVGGTASTDDGHGNLTVFLPVLQDSNSLLFVEGTASANGDGINEGNVALGMRRIFDNEVIVGGWAGFDVRSSEQDNTFQRISFGLEAMTEVYDARVNGYVALSDPATTPNTARAVLSGNSIALAGTEEVALSGVDGEVGARVLDFDTDALLSGTTQHELRFYAGGYHFRADEAAKNLSGPRLRAEYRIDNIIPALPGSRLSFVTRYQHDRVRDHQFAGGIQLRIPFNVTSDSYAGELSPLERRMSERLERTKEVLVTEAAPEAVTDVLTGVSFDQFVQLGAGQNLTAAAQAAGPNTLIVADGGTHTGPQALTANQTLQGGGSTIVLRGQRTGTQVAFTAPGSRPTFRNTQTVPTLTIAANTHVNGINVQGLGGTTFTAGNIGIFGTGNLGTSVITNNTLTDLGADGVSLFPSSGTNTLTISGNTVDRIGDEGIFLEPDGNAVTNAFIRNNTIRNTGFDGIDVQMFGTSRTFVLIEGNTLDQVGDDGIDVSMNQSSVTTAHVIGNRVLSAPNDDGLDFDARDSSVNTLLIADNVVLNTSGDSLDFNLEQNSRTFGTVRNNVGISGVPGAGAQDGFDLELEDNAFAQFQVTNNQFLGAPDDGLFLDLDDNSVGIFQFSNNIFSSTNQIIGGAIDVDTDNNSRLSLQMTGNIANQNFVFRELGASTFQLESTLNKNTLQNGSVLQIGAGIGMVPAQTFFPLPPS
ncbi:MAG: inverse autotransporter beta domain-containing protein [Pseudomonadota bacterium]